MASRKFTMTDNPFIVSFGSGLLGLFLIGVCLLTIVATPFVLIRHIGSRWTTGRTQRDADD